MNIWACRFSSILFVSSILLSHVSCQDTSRRPERHLIPEGYVGWLRIDFGIKDAPPIPVEDGYHLFKFSSSGRLQTSTENEYGWAKDEFYYYSDSTRIRLAATGWGAGGMIWGESNGWSGTTYEKRTATYEHFFVGTEEQFRKYADLKNEDGLPKVGNLKAEDAHSPVGPTPKPSKYVRDPGSEDFGTTTINVTRTAANGFQAAGETLAKIPAPATIVAGAAVKALAPGGTIDFSVNLKVSGSGQVSYVNGVSKGYPSYAVYSYTVGENGKIQTRELRRRVENKTEDLTKPMTPF
jgi:hypothetical protein